MASFAFERQGQHAVVELRADLLLIDLVRQRERPGEMANIVFGVQRVHRFRLIPLGAREIEGQDPVSVFGLDPVCVDFDRQGDRAIEPSGEPLATMQRPGGAVVDGLAAGNSDGVALDPDIEVRLADARQLGDQHDIVTLPKDVERRVGAGGRPQSGGLSARPHGGAALWRALC
ncbi:MAG TPA: hypothetical protein VNW89_07000 [Stellaceae bacterium]|nr:hypothetical protein [Stellaceae bacterium]